MKLLIDINLFLVDDDVPNDFFQIIRKGKYAGGLFKITSQHNITATMQQCAAEVTTLSTEVLLLLKPPTTSPHQGN